MGPAQLPDDLDGEVRRAAESSREGINYGDVPCPTLATESRRDLYEILVEQRPRTRSVLLRCRGTFLNLRRKVSCS